MLSITGMNKFYYIKNFTDMRCKYNRILAVIRKFMIIGVVMTNFLGESEVKAIMTYGYNAYNFLDGTLSVDYLLCMVHALNYFDHFKEGLFMYRKDGRYPIDNNLAECQVRPFTALRKSNTTIRK